MILINRLFKRPDTRLRIVETNREKKDVFDFFNIKPGSIPDNTFVESRLRFNNDNEIVRKFKKKLISKECNIFDYLEVEDVGGKHKRITFKCYSPGKVRIKDIKQLINELAFLYKKDGVGRDLFTGQDKAEFKQKEFFDVFGRMWLDYTKYKYPVMISRDKHELSLKIWCTIK